MAIIIDVSDGASDSTARKVAGSQLELQRGGNVFIRKSNKAMLQSIYLLQKKSLMNCLRSR